MRDLNRLRFLAVAMLLNVSILSLDPLSNQLPFVFRYLLIAGAGIPTCCWASRS